MKVRRETGRKQGSMLRETVFGQTDRGFGCVLGNLEYADERLNREERDDERSEIESRAKLTCLLARNEEKRRDLG